MNIFDLPEELLRAPTISPPIMRPIRCPACGELRAFTWSTANGVTVYECLNCDGQFSDAAPDTVTLGGLYVKCDANE